jgi:hypothetical protein
MAGIIGQVVRMIGVSRMILHSPRKDECGRMGNPHLVYLIVSSPFPGGVSIEQFFRPSSTSPRRLLGDGD